MRTPCARAKPVPTPPAARPQSVPCGGVGSAGPWSYPRRAWGYASGLPVRVDHHCRIVCGRAVPRLRNLYCGGRRQNGPPEGRGCRSSPRTSHPRLLAGKPLHSPQRRPRHAFISRANECGSISDSAPCTSVCGATAPLSSLVPDTQRTRYCTSVECVRAGVQEARPLSAEPSRPPS